MSKTDKIALTNVKEWGNTLGSVEYIQEKNIGLDLRILDIGCNSGSLVYKLWKLGYKESYGVDIDSRIIEKGAELYPQISHKLYSYDGVTLPFENGKFDVVTMFDVLEHIDSVDEFLYGEVDRVLTNGGLFLFQTPNKLTNIPWEILTHKSLFGYKAYHVSLQSYSSLRRLLEGGGFKEIVIEKRTINTVYYIEQLKAQLGFMAYPVLYLADSAPLCWATNFWGHCRKPLE
jgi:SAM-dependent methyltransferase